MRKSASANCRRRANQRASQRIIILLHGTILTDHGANKELKSGSLAPPLPTRAARRQRPTLHLRREAQQSGVRCKRVLGALMLASQ